MTDIPKLSINELMQKIPLNWRYYWCDAVVCACLGCANCAGGLGEHYNKEAWNKWVLENPEPPRVFCKRCNLDITEGKGCLCRYPLV